MGKPDRDPLGAKPVLPPPTGDAADRASKAFREYVDEARSATASRRGPPPRSLPAETRDPAGSLPDPDSFGGGRRYDLALSMLDAGREDAAAPASIDPEAVMEGSRAPQSSSTPASIDPEAVMEASRAPESSSAPAPIDPEAVTDVSPAPASSNAPAPLDRPPPGVPAVRPPVRRGTPDTVPQELLQTAADSAMLSADPDGTTSFDIAFSDELFENLACRISFADGRIVATFRVADDNTRRLLEAESRALIARLEDRGLKVQEVRVDMV
jgi:hypothetical protein